MRTLFLRFFCIIMLWIMNIVSISYQSLITKKMCRMQVMEVHLLLLQCQCKFQLPCEIIWLDHNQSLMTIFVIICIFTFDLRSLFGPEPMATTCPNCRAQIITCKPQLSNCTILVVINLSINNLIMLVCWWCLLITIVIYAQLYRVIFFFTNYCKLI